MHSQVGAYLVGAAALIASLVYIGRQLRGLAALITFITNLPQEHRDLVMATSANTQAIATLTNQVSALTADVATLVAR